MPAGYYNPFPDSPVYYFCEYSTKAGSRVCDGDPPHLTSACPDPAAMPHLHFGGSATTAATAAAVARARQWVEYMHNKRKCKKGKVIYYTLRHAGIGSDVGRAIYAFHSALMQNMSLVLSPQWHWAGSGSIETFFNVGTCQKVAMKRDLQYAPLPPQAFFEPDFTREHCGLAFSVPKHFEGSLSMYQWLSVLTQVLLRPVLKGDSGATRAMVNTLATSPRPFIGVHIRGGDACVPVINDFRPPCNTRPYEGVLAALRTWGIASGTFLLSTDETAVVTEFQTHLREGLFQGNFSLVFHEIGREKYNLSTFIETSHIDRPAALADAVQELHLLAQSDVFIGSMYRCVYAPRAP